MLKPDNAVDNYIANTPEERQNAMNELRQTMLSNLPDGFEETINYNMIGYVVPHSLYPKGYHCDPKQALPFINIASQKNFVAIYHMGIYASPSLMEWFTAEYPKHSKTKLDMGKSCIRFKKPNDIPFALIGELVAKMTPAEWIECYETAFRKNQ